MKVHLITHTQDALGKVLAHLFNDQNDLQPDDFIVPSDLTNLCINKGLFSHTLGNESSWTGGT